MTAADAFPPASYRLLCAMRKRGEGYPAPGPCAIPGCIYLAQRIALAQRTDRYRREHNDRLHPPFAWDHCHAHDHVRGMLCQDHNQQMIPIDDQDHWGIALRLRLWAGREGLAWRFPLADLLAYWERCPGCAAIGPWAPVMARHSPGMVRRSRELAEVEARRAASAARAAALQAQLEAESARRCASALKGVATRRARQAGRS